MEYSAAMKKTENYVQMHKDLQIISLPFTQVGRIQNKKRVCVYSGCVCVCVCKILLGMYMHMYLCRYLPKRYPERTNKTNLKAVKQQN